MTSKPSQPLCAPGQRYLSRSEPELGLGIVTTVDGRYAEVTFRAADTVRRYDVRSAPIHRVLFRPGDTIHDRQGAAHTIHSVQTGTTVVYVCDTGVIAESELDDREEFSSPSQRLLNGIVDSTETFDRRRFLLDSAARMRGARERGFLGGRINLLPHQLFIADSVASRRIPRALLCDETGLGKTIEACLIMQRLLLTGRIERALMVVPSALVHQWFVELLRRFNMTARLFTPEFCESCEADQNPFAADQIGIVSLEYLVGTAIRAQQAIDATWDLVIVDEAHHVKENSRGYEIISALAPPDRGLLLLTATPEQLGRRGHFARLHLLDPMRYIDFDRHEQESRRFHELSQFIESFCSRNNIDITSADTADIVFENDPELNRLLEHPDQTDTTITLEQLIDRHGIGRALFRNTRAVVGGFPSRQVSIDPLDTSPKRIAVIDAECRCDWDGTEAVCTPPDHNDPRIQWLVSLIRSIPERKILVMCTTRGKAIAVQTALAALVRIDIAIFHEDMTILQRDRNAAWFADPAGARLLVCSENGSEGRNFQFCHHMALFDFPLEPEVLEQRIGRLDRIGQRNTIYVHVPCVRGTAQEVLCRWYNEGVNAFAQNVAAAGRVHELTNEQFLACAFGSASLLERDKRLSELLSRTNKLCAEISTNLAQGRDRLLEIASFNPRRARVLVERVQAAGRHTIASDVLDTLFDHYGIMLEDGGLGTMVMITEYCTDHAFPLPRHERPVITYDRRVALDREDVIFLTSDHPMVTGGLDLFLCSDQGTSAFALWEEKGVKELLLETCHVAECVAPLSLYPDRFFPPTPIHVVVNHNGTDCSAALEQTSGGPSLVNAPVERFMSNASITGTVFPALLSRANEVATEKAHAQAASAIAVMQKELDQELQRLEEFARHGAAGTQSEMDRIRLEREALSLCFAQVRVRLDSLRLIWHGPPPSGRS